MKIKIFTLLVLSFYYSLFGQFKKIGLADNKVLSITTAENSYYGKIILAGTVNNGMFFHTQTDADSVWLNLFGRSKTVSAVYAQELDADNTKLFWAMLADTSEYNPLIFSNVMPVQSAILLEDSGLDKSRVNEIRYMSGFNYLPGGVQMPLYCCTNDPAVYKYENRAWSKSWEGPDKLINFNFVYAADSTVWAGGVFNGIIAAPFLLKSRNFGGTWDTLSLPAGEVFSCYSLAACPGNPEIVFVGLNEHVLKSVDGGITWIDCLPDINNAIFTGIVINPLKPGQIFAGGKTYGNDLVLFKSDDYGERWKQLLTDCNCIFKGINTMAGTVVENKFVIFIGTDGGGLYQYSENVSSSAKLKPAPEIYNLFQNYPNPFNPETKIKYGIPKSGPVVLTLMDILGREIKTLVNEFQNAGIHEINFNAGGLSSGIYFYKITCGNFTSVKKMILLR